MRTETSTETQIGPRQKRLGVLSGDRLFALGVAPRNLGWLGCAVQFAGTLWFNWSTANALRTNLSAAVADQRVWRPDALGSIAFLVASGLALMDARRIVVVGRPKPRIGVANMVGSVAFGVSAVACYVVPATGDVWNDGLTNLGTFVGAGCFFTGAILLMPPGTAAAPVPANPRIMSCRPAPARLGSARRAQALSDPGPGAHW